MNLDPREKKRQQREEHRQEVEGQGDGGAKGTKKEKPKWFFQYSINMLKGFPGGSVVKNLPANVGGAARLWVGKIPWRRKWQPTPIFLPGKSHEQRSLAGYSPWDRKGVRHDLLTKQQQQNMLIRRQRGKK